MKNLPPLYIKFGGDARAILTEYLCGMPPDAATRAFVEPRLGFDFATVEAKGQIVISIEARKAMQIKEAEELNQAAPD